MIDPVLDEVLGSKVPHDNYRQLVNPTGSFILGGPAADAGLTGRKIIVDTCVLSNFCGPFRRFF